MNAAPPTRLHRVRQAFARAAPYFAYLYLLRVPLLSLALLVVAASSVRSSSGLNSLLRGVFDLEAPGWSGVSAFALVTLAAMMAATTIAISARIIILDGHDRFGVGEVPSTDGVELAMRLPLVAGLAVIGAALYETWSGWSVLVTAAPGIAVGLIVYWVLMTSVHDRLWDYLVDDSPVPSLLQPLIDLAGWLRDGFRWVASFSPRGFLLSPESPTSTLKPRHVFAVIHLLISLAVYGLLFFVKQRYGLLNGIAFVSTTARHAPHVPTLCLLMVFVMLLCSALSALTFFFDRFRVPVILLLALYGWGVAQLPQADYFYRSRPRLRESPVPPTRLVRRLGDRPLVLVAAAGGGIQAAAWTARVIAGLQEDVAADHIDFSRSLRLISGVSGGSVGALFIAAAYTRGSLHDVELGDAELAEYDPERAAQASSLDDVAWGLVYPDLIWSALPEFKGIYLSPRALLQGNNLASDRGLALENAWRSRLPKTRRATLAAWRSDARMLHRPGVLFNSTLVETGERLVIGTVDVDGTSGGGLHSFRSRYPDRDLEVTTAARLSATFPYVSPATRILRGEQHDDVLRDEPHAVDGGYYDNYGMVSLTEWLRALKLAGATPRQILLIQIRAFDETTKPGRGEHGTLFQAGNPLEALYNVRGNGQRAHAELETALLHDIWGDCLVPVPFVFSPADEHFTPPLSWHLTAHDRAMLADAWGRAQAARERVRAVMRGEAAKCPPPPPSPPSPALEELG